MKPSFHSLILFLLLLCNCKFRRLDSVQFLCSQAYILADWRMETLFSAAPAEHFTLHGRRRKEASIVKEACLLIHCLAMDVVFRALAPAGMCLPSRYLARGLYVTIHRC
jgi:hypothetical protein